MAKKFIDKVSIQQGEVRAFLKGPEMVKLNKKVGEIIVQNLGSGYEYVDMGNSQTRAIGRVVNNTENSYFKEANSGRLARASRRKIGEITEI